jgi:2-oxoglutarate ferredoxin oxidoreductase subunit delta
MGTEETESKSAVTIARATTARPSSRRGHPTIFGTWCKGCGLCIEFCPQSVFEADSQGRPTVAHPEWCTACHWCDTHCPDMAIAVRLLDQDEVEELEEMIELAERGVLPGGDL